MMNYKLGKLPAKISPKTYKMDAVLTSTLVTIPEEYNWANGWHWEMWCNDAIGCCTQVSVASAIKVWTVNTNKAVILTDADVISNYSQESGYVPGEPNTDQGGVELDVLTMWVNEGYTTPNTVKNKLYAFGSVNLNNLDTVKRAIYALGGCYIGISVPNYAMSSSDNTWDLETSDNEIIGGHAVFLHGYDENYFYLNTWGQNWKMSYDFFRTYCDEAYALVSQDWLEGKDELSPLKEGINSLVTEMRAS